MEYFLIALGVFLFLRECLIGGLYARMDGGGEPKTPEIVERILCMKYFVIACIPFAGWWSLIAFSGVVGIVTGLGQYFLSLSVKAIEPEKIDFAVRLAFGEDPRCDKRFAHLRGRPLSEYTSNEREQILELMKNYGLEKLYRRCVFGMFVRGSLVGLPAAIIVLCFGHVIPALLLASTGLASAAAYVIGDKYFNSTEPAEWINGTVRTALALAALSMGVYLIISS